VYYLPEERVDGKLSIAGGIIPVSILDDPAPTHLLHFVALSPPREYGWK
jgi:hypothetical protein